MKAGSLFSGIGGLDLGLERAGMDIRWQSEIHLYASRVLAKNWPNVPNLGDVKEIDWSTVERVDLICGGYPCQPFSLSGARAGESDPRHLWPFFATALRELRPRWALLENVPGHLSLGFGRVLGDLAELGFDAEWDCISANDVGAPHLRSRVFIVARDRNRSGSAVFVADSDSRGQQQPSGPVEEVGRRTPNGSEPLADTESVAERESTDQAESITTGWNARTQSGSGGWWTTEPDVGRVADGVPARMDRLRGLGNAVVPQVAEWIGRRIMAASQ